MTITQLDKDARVLNLFKAGRCLAAILSDNIINPTRTF